MQVPLTSLRQAVGVMSFPILARRYSEGRLDELDRTLSAALKGPLAMMIPVTALVIAQSEPVVYLVFSHTRLQLQRGGLSRYRSSPRSVLRRHARLDRAVPPLARVFRHAQQLDSAVVGTATTLAKCSSFCSPGS